VALAREYLKDMDLDILEIRSLILGRWFRLVGLDIC